jgi:hypothetical protein
MRKPLKAKRSLTKKQKAARNNPHLPEDAAPVDLTLVNPAGRCIASNALIDRVGLSAGAVELHSDASCAPRA